MEGKFFKKPQQEIFEKEIRSYVKKIKGYDEEELTQHSDLPQYIMEAETFMLTPGFIKLPSDLKKQVRDIHKLLIKLYKISSKTETPNCFIQIPSSEHIRLMEGMPAGGTEDQASRLANMSAVVEQVHTENPMLPVSSTDIPLPLEWERVFFAINQGDKKAAIELFKAIPREDKILQPLLRVHPSGYMQELIILCINAQLTGYKTLNADIVIKPRTFEILIRDLATTLMNPAKLRVSFGLPTHHAYSEEGSGFCIINKTAILMRHVALNHFDPLRYVVVGTDVNRDNGLCDILRFFCSDMSICHVDIFDSRVYPWHDHSHIEKEFQKSATSAGNKIKCWTQGQFNYYAVDLSLTVRNKISVHPALLFALEKIKETINQAIEHQTKVFIILPTGWDSHQAETAPCGKLIGNHMMAEYETTISRFNDGDLNYFFNAILKLYNKNKEHVEGIYWGLEGGYEPEVYTKQIASMLNTIIEQHFLQDTAQHSYPPSY